MIVALVGGTETIKTSRSRRENVAGPEGHFAVDIATID
jgi:hypothetical protein